MRATLILVVAAALGAGVAQSGSAAGGPTTVQIAAKEFAYTPKTVAVGSGMARFVVTNAGTMEHDFVIEALKVKSPMIKPGQTVTVLVTGGRTMENAWLGHG